MFYIITLPYACFGVITKNDIVTETPPIARWMVGKTITQIKKWVETKRGWLYCSKEK